MSNAVNAGGTFTVPQALFVLNIAARTTEAAEDAHWDLVTTVPGLKTCLRHNRINVLKMRLCDGRACDREKSEPLSTLFSSTRLKRGKRRKLTALV